MDMGYPPLEASQISIGDVKSEMVRPSPSEISLANLHAERLEAMSVCSITGGDLEALEPSIAGVHEELLGGGLNGVLEPAEPANAVVPRELSVLLAPPRIRRKTRKVYMKLGDISAKIQKLKRKRNQVKLVLSQKKALLKEGLKNKLKAPSVSLYTGVGKAKLEASAIRKKLFDLRSMRKRTADAFVSEDEISQEDTDDEASENNSQQDSDEEDSENSQK